MGPPQIIKEPYEEQSVIKVQAQGIKPLKYLWLKDNQELRDSIDYTGSTTPELHIVGTSSQVKGEYKCQVTNELGELFSQSILYGRSNSTPTYYFFMQNLTFLL